MIVPAITLKLWTDEAYLRTLAIISVFNKTGLLDLAKGLIQNGVRLLASGGTAKLIRDAGFQVESVSLDDG